MPSISATRTELLKARQQREIAQKGLALLEAKREALRRELLGQLQPAARVREALRQQVQRARNALVLELALCGPAQIRSLSFACQRDLTVEIEERHLWGVLFPEIRWRSAVRFPGDRGYGALTVSQHTEEAILRFEELVDRALETLQAELKIRRLAVQWRRTTRRIRAIQDRVLPELETRIREIEGRLEEREREDHLRIKRFKDHQARKRNRES